jgi:hypothetical protein
MLHMFNLDKYEKNIHLYVDDDPIIGLLIFKKKIQRCYLGKLNYNRPSRIKCF